MGDAYLRFGWLLVLSLYKEAFAVSGKVERSVNRFNLTIWVTSVTPTDRRKSVRNSCVIKVFGGVLCCHVAFWIVLWV